MKRGVSIILVSLFFWVPLWATTTPFGFPLGATLETVKMNSRELGSNDFFSYYFEPFQTKIDFTTDINAHDFSLYFDDEYGVFRIDAVFNVTTRNAIKVFDRLSKDLSSYYERKVLEVSPKISGENIFQEIGENNQTEPLNAIVLDDRSFVFIAILPSDRDPSFSWGNVIVNFTSNKYDEAKAHAEQRFNELAAQQKESYNPFGIDTTLSTYNSLAAIIDKKEAAIKEEFLTWFPVNPPLPSSHFSKYYISFLSPNNLRIKAVERISPEAAIRLFISIQDQMTLQFGNPNTYGFSNTEMQRRILYSQNANESIFWDGIDIDKNSLLPLNIFMIELTIKSIDFSTTEVSLTYSI